MMNQAEYGLRGGWLGLAVALALSLLLWGCGGDGGDGGAQDDAGPDVTDDLGSGGGGADATASSGTPPPPQGGRGQACRPGGDCDAPLVCDAGTCVDAPDDEGGLGGACRADGTCDAGLACVDDVCRAEGAAEGELGGTCRGDGSCDAGLECRNGLCRTAPLPPSEPAPPTEPPPGGTGDPCERNADCPDGVCLPLADNRQVCTLRCESDAGCIPGWRCAPIGGIEGQVCQCTPGVERCNGMDDSCNGRVDTPLSPEEEALVGVGLCSDDAQCCADDDCEAGFCCEGLRCVPCCRSNADCAAGTCCAKATRSCELCCASSAECSAGEVCCGDTCVAGQCCGDEDCALSEESPARLDCPSGEVCVDGACV